MPGVQNKKAKVFLSLGHVFSDFNQGFLKTSLHALKIVAYRYTAYISGFFMLLKNHIVYLLPQYQAQAFLPEYSLYSDKQR
jgi:hypothetical protein